MFVLDITTLEISATTFLNWLKCNESILTNFKKEKLYEPIYNLDDVNNALAHIQEYEENIVWAFNEEIKFRFIPAGHIRYSEQIELFVNVNNCQKKLVYTGDLGNYIIPKLFSNQ